MAVCTMTPRYLDAEHVRGVLTWTLVNEAVEEALKAVDAEASSEESSGSYMHQPVRTLTTCGRRGQVLFTMPAYVGNYSLHGPGGGQDPGGRHNTLACKLVTSFPTNQQRQPPLANILANILLFDTSTGQLQCIMEGTQITAWRTAAASIVATKYLYFERSAGDVCRAIRVAIVGCGVQGESHAFGMCATFNVSELYLWNRTRARAETLAAKLRAAPSLAPQLRVHVVETPAGAVKQADVICVATSSPTALIDYNMLQCGCNVHINAIGAGQVHFGEVGQDIYDHAVVYVDSAASAQVELKELKARIIGEVGEVIRRGKRPENELITIFQSMGMAAEDATVAQAVYDSFVRKENKLEN